MLIERVTAEGYAGHRERVCEVIVRCRATLTRGTGMLGAWGAGQLDMSTQAVDANSTCDSR